MHRSNGLTSAFWRRFLDVPKMKSQLLQLLVVVAIMFAIIEFACYGPPRFWHDFSGMTEAEVRSRLGEPFRDNRKNGDGNAKKYTLAWRQGFERALFIDFSDGRAVSQRRVRR